MGDRLSAAKPSQYVTSHTGQLSLLLPSVTAFGLSSNNERLRFSLYTLTLHTLQIVVLLLL